MPIRTYIQLDIRQSPWTEKPAHQLLKTAAATAAVVVVVVEKSNDKVCVGNRS